MKAKNLTRALSVALALAVLAAFLPLAAVAQTFTDVPESYGELYTAVEFLAEAGIVSGDQNGDFHPERILNRSDMAVLICNAQSFIGGGPINKVPDTPIEDEDDLPFWAYDQINHAVAEGWMVLDEEGKFNPNATLTRQELAHAVAYLIDCYYPTYDYSDFAEFDDRDEIDDDYINAVGFLTLAGVVSGSEGKFDPEGEVTRGIWAVLLYRALTWELPEGWTYPDVPPGHPAYNAVEWLVENGIVSGSQDGLFHPDGLPARAEIAVFMCMAKGVAPEGIPAEPIPDIDAHWGAPSINHAVAEGWMVLDGDGKFNPDSNISRQEMAGALAHLFDIYDPDYYYSDYLDYGDNLHIDPSYTNAIGFLTLAGVVRGDNLNNFRPDGGINRWEFVLLLHRVLTEEFPDSPLGWYKVAYYADSLSDEPIGVEYVMRKDLDIGDRLTPAAVSGSRLGGDWLKLYAEACPDGGKHGVALVSYPTIKGEPKLDVVKVLYMPVNS